MVCLVIQEGRCETGMFVRLFPSKCPTKRLGVTNPQLFYLLFRNPVIRHVKGLTLSFHLHHWGPLEALRDSLSTKMSAFGT